MLDAIGYLKAPDTAQTIAFGSGLVMSDDATIMAVSSSSGIHIFQRSGVTWSQQTQLDFKSEYALLSGVYRYTLSLSGNGDVLAIGDTLDDSAATGVDGDQTDTSASNSDTVYPF